MKTLGNHLDWIHIAKGIGIILVVIGHFIPQQSPEYWIDIRKVVYSFHMPLFFILSGYLYNDSKYSYKELIKTKIKRLLYPFVSIAGIFYVIKSIAGRVVNLDYPVSIDSLYVLLVDPVNSYMPLLWFVHALFLIFVIFPILALFLNKTVILLAFLMVNVIFGSEYLVVGRALAFMPFFIVGVMLRSNTTLSNVTTSHSSRFICASLLLFCLGYTLNLFESGKPYYAYLIHFYIGVTGSLVVIFLSHALNASRSILNRVLYSIGYFSMSIYLFHTLFESTVRIFFKQVANDMEAPFEMVAMVAIISGIIFPLILEKHMLRKYLFTKKFFLGLG